MTGDALEHLDVQRRNQELLTQTDIERLRGSALLQNTPYVGDVATRIVPDGVIATH
jgi:hypothetical protein